MSIPTKSLLTALTLGIASPLFAGTTPAPTKEVTIIEETTETEKDWWFRVGINSWLTAMKGDMGVRGLTSKVNVTMKETIDHLDMASMASMEFGYKRWSIGLDGIYAKFSDEVHYERGPISGKADIDFEQAILTGRLQYRLVDTEDFVIDGYAGVRWTYLNTEINTHTRLSFNLPALQQFDREWSRHYSFSRDWYDPIIGLRTVVNMSPSWYLQLSGDVGGFGVGSKFTWQTVAGVGYNFNKHVSLLVAYRAIGVDYDKDNFRLNTVTHGPFTSLIFSF